MAVPACWIITRNHAISLKDAWVLYTKPKGGSGWMDWLPRVIHRGLGPLKIKALTSWGGGRSRRTCRVLWTPKGKKLKSYCIYLGVMSKIKIWSRAQKENVWPRPWCTVNSRFDSTNLFWLEPVVRLMCFFFLSNRKVVRVQIRTTLLCGGKSISHASETFFLYTQYGYTYWRVGTVRDETSAAVVAPHRNTNEKRLPPCRCM